MNPMLRVTAVEPVRDFVLRITFSDGVVREVDVDRLLRGPVFEPLRSDPEAFRSVRIDPVFGSIEWPNGADIDTLVLHGDFEPAWTEDEEEAPRGHG